MKTALITGGSAGLGKITATRLAKEGYRVLIAARDREKGEAVAQQIREETGNQEVRFFAVDMSDAAQVSALAAEVKAHTDVIDRLILNAGLFTQRIRTNAAGQEYMFAATHLGHFQLTHECFALLKASEEARVIVTSSVAHWVGTRLDFFDTIEHPPRGDRFGLRQFYLYGRSKLANILFVNGLEKRLQGTNIRAFAFHPGGVKTEFYRQFPDWVTRIFFPFLISEEKGADTQIWLALDTDPARRGGYWVRRKPGIRSRASRDEELSERLWEVSETMTGIAEFGAAD